MSNHLPKPPLSNARRWIIVISAALFFFYEFIQMNLLNSIAPHLLRELQINATQLGTMSSLYFIANVIFLIPAGMLLDRYSIRRIIIITLGICILGTMLFACIHSYSGAITARFLTGIGAAFCFLSIIKLASRWFPPKRLALITGVIVSMAMAGGMTAQAPLVFIVNHVGWRNALWIDAALGMIILGWIYIIVKDHPPGVDLSKEHHLLSQIGLWQSIRLAVFRLHNWLGASYAALMNLLLILMGGLWGQMYLTHVHHITAIKAASITSLLFLGTIIGSPIYGWLSDHFHARRLPMLIGALTALGLIIIVTQAAPLGATPLALLFFALGLFTSSQILAYPYVAENSPPMITAMSVSIVNICVQGSIALAEPLFGFIMDWHYHHRVSHYSSADFQRAMWMFMVCFSLSFILALLLRQNNKTPLP